MGVKKEGNNESTPSARHSLRDESGRGGARDAVRCRSGAEERALSGPGPSLPFPSLPLPAERGEPGPRVGLPRRPSLRGARRAGRERPPGAGGPGGAAGARRDGAAARPAP